MSSICLHIVNSDPICLWCGLWPTRPWSCRDHGLPAHRYGETKFFARSKLSSHIDSIIVLSKTTSSWSIELRPKLYTHPKKIKSPVCWVITIIARCTLATTAYSENFSNLAKIIARSSCVPGIILAMCHKTSLLQIKRNPLAVLSIFAKAKTVKHSLSKGVPPVERHALLVTWLVYPCFTTGWPYLIFVTSTTSGARVNFFWPV